MTDEQSPLRSEMTAHEQPALYLDVMRLTLAFFRDLPSGSTICAGEAEVVLDSDDTAWVKPCQRLSMTDEVIGLIAGHLRPLGIKWMRGWGDGGRMGRVITANGPVSCEPWSEVYDAGT